MRTTVSITDELLAAAKRRARSKGQSLGSVIDAALRRELLATPAADDRPTVPVFRGGTGPGPGLDLTSNRVLYEVLDEGVAIDRRR
ncbi:MAG: antitoxin [Nocardioidaceae bacterium]|nr:antitoxin [Nocardioidaceae bacterium]